MEQYINKSALIAEIENRRDEISKRRITIPLTGRDKSYATFFEYEILGKIRDIIDTLEVKEVDLEKEYKIFVDCDEGRSMFETAKHFFELGLKTKGK